MKTKAGLQKFTESEAKINKFLELEQITLSDYEKLSDPDKQHFLNLMTEKLNHLKGTEHDKLYKKLELIIDTSTKNQMWENNHNQITWAISTLMQDYGRMPSKTEIAAKTQLSRQTVHKHLKEYANHPQHLEQVEQFSFMTSKVLAKVFQFAVNGDIGAAKLYFSVTGSLTNGQATNNTLIQNQNNYIQINGTVLSQETIKQLNPEQLNTIETILKAALPNHDPLQNVRLKHSNKN